jgi:hypothetical protein
MPIWAVSTHRWRTISDSDERVGLVVSAKGTLKRETLERVEDLESFLERPAIAHSARIATAGFMAAFVTLLVIAFS